MQYFFYKKILFGIYLYLHIYLYLNNFMSSLFMNWFKFNHAQ